MVLWTVSLVVFSSISSSVSAGFLVDQFVIINDDDVY